MRFDKDNDHMQVPLSLKERALRTLKQVQEKRDTPYAYGNQVDLNPRNELDEELERLLMTLQSNENDRVLVRLVFKQRTQIKGLSDTVHYYAQQYHELNNLLNNVIDIVLAQNKEKKDAPTD